MASLCFAEGESKTKVYGKEITLKEATPIKSINSDPQQYVDKEVLIAGKVVAVCKGMGCWVEVMTPDSQKIICRSLDESVTVPKDCEGRFIQVQGKVKFDKKASGKAEMKAHEGMAAHACPAPKVLVCMEGASFLNVPATSVSTSAHPATTAAPASIDKPTNVEKTESATPAAVEKKDAPATTVQKDAPVTAEKKTPPAPPTPTK
jgi:hypothetical protein